MSKKPRGTESSDFVHHFEGASTLDGLLELAGSPYDTEAVLALMKEAHADGASSSELIPQLFEGPPRFPSPDVARLMYQNLLGLWDLVAEGKGVRLEDEGPRPPRPKREKAPAPSPFAPGEPDAAFVEAASRHLEEDVRARERLTHLFDNRQDPLLGALDGAGLTDEGYAVARYLLFELFAMLELGWPAGVATVPPGALATAPTPDAPPVPAALATYAEDALFEAEHDEEHPLVPEELAPVRNLVTRGLAALWQARKKG
ncbi:hypothetical protein FGE12_28860 [Aggregicoccus sp. 17bor-14]|uniref:hypothetical protein n=1 Tax=Myxococcaceae TaxID=31 RepID=UPI00129C39E8|nr:MULTISPECIES: hypothetical protein [Myxococcaceae]MBF5046459.1 hypothetical protein [Simulacricoccus sp. 17bor-14]MRI92177.1 hypothetical protein [Aggregicoccus sp. 17bor-14]